MKKKHSLAYAIWLLFLIIVLGLSLWLTIDAAMQYAQTPHLRWLKSPEAADIIHLIGLV
ncbi:MAG: hypothetical protein GX858_09250 [Clostridiales bacterium]|nr:hypothetical protein [Clostridiales bacterium]